MLLVKPSGRVALSLKAAVGWGRGESATLVRSYRRLELYVVRWQSGKAEEAIPDRQDMTAGPSPLCSPLSPGGKVETGTIPTFLAARRSHLSSRYNPPCSFIGGAKIT